MKKAIGILIILAFSLSLFAATGSINLRVPGTVNGTQLSAGDYKLDWTGEGENVQVNIIGKGVKVTVPASITRSSQKLADAVVKSTDGTINEVHISGKNLIVKFNAPVSAPKGQ